jgi:hypothetical protein
MLSHRSASAPSVGESFSGLLFQVLYQRAVSRYPEIFVAPKSDSGLDVVRGYSRLTCYLFTVGAPATLRTARAPPHPTTSTSVPQTRSTTPQRNHTTTEALFKHNDEMEQQRAQDHPDVVHSHVSHAQDDPSCDYIERASGVNAGISPVQDQPPALVVLATKFVDNIKVSVPFPVIRTT